MPARCEGRQAAAASQAAGWWAPMSKAAPRACAGCCTHASSPPVFLRVHCAWQRLSAGWLFYTSKQNRPGTLCTPKKPAVHARWINQPKWMDISSPSPKQGGQIQFGLGEQSPSCVTPAWALCASGPAAQTEEQVSNLTAWLGRHGVLPDAVFEPHGQRCCAGSLLWSIVPAF